jgi:hypothetical protein
MKYLSIILLFVFLLGCKMDVDIEKEIPLAGTTWEQTSGKASTEDTTFTFPESPYDRCIMIFGKTHWILVRQDTSRKFIDSQSGTYTVDGENVTVAIEMITTYEDIGKTVNWKFQINGDQVIFKATGYRAIGYDWKEVHQAWKRID